MRFIKFTFSVLVICALIIVALEFSFRDYKTQADSLFIRYNSKKQNVQTLYIGNSHIGTFNDLFPDEIKEVGNMSLGGQDIFRMYTVIKTIIPQSPNLKKIYMGLDYDLLGYNQVKSGQEYIDRQYYKYTDTLYNNTTTNRAMSLSAFFRSNRDIAYLWQKKKKEEQNKNLNFIPVANAPVTNAADTSSAPVSNTPAKIFDPFMCRKRAEEHTLLKFKQKNIDENLQYLLSIVEVCKKNNVQLILFDPPKTTCYKEYSNKEVVVGAKNTIDSFSLANKISYLDYYNDTTFTDEMFVDYDHLNPIGVKILLNKLATP